MSRTEQTICTWLILSQPNPTQPNPEKQNSSVHQLSKHTSLRPHPCAFFTPSFHFFLSLLNRTMRHFTGLSLWKLPNIFLSRQNSLHDMRTCWLAPQTDFSRRQNDPQNPDPPSPPQRNDSPPPHTPPHQPSLLPTSHSSASNPPPRPQLDLISSPHPHSTPHSPSPSPFIPPLLFPPSSSSSSSSRSRSSYRTRPSSFAPFHQYHLKLPLYPTNFFIDCWQMHVRGAG